MRLSRPQMFMEIAHIVAKRSTCMRLNVGAVIVVNRRIVSIGYNGSPPGDPHCLGDNCPGAKHGCTTTIHAEENALKYMPAVEGPGDLYVTDSPCSRCFNLIVNSGVIRRVFFETPYRISDHISPDRGLAVYRVTPAGYVVDWFTGGLVDVET